jgi:hypothetical protein
MNPFDSPILESTIRRNRPQFNRRLIYWVRREGPVRRPYGVSAGDMVAFVPSGHAVLGRGRRTSVELDAGEQVRQQQEHDWAGHSPPDNSDNGGLRG